MECLIVRLNPKGPMGEHTDVLEEEPDVLWKSLPFYLLVEPAFWRHASGLFEVVVEHRF